MEEIRAVTGFDAGLSGDAQIRIALRAILANGGIAQMPEIYAAVEQHMNGVRLSEQGKASLRNFINRAAVQAGYVYPRDPNIAGWRITPEGKEFLESEAVPEEVTNVDTELPVILPSNSVRGAAFENYVLRLLKKIYPNYAWYSQGVHKNNERGLDFIGSQIGKVADNPQFIGVQVKFHAENTVPSQLEWLKFLAGCFARQVDHAVFITTGRLTSEQRREAGEAKVVVIEGREEISRIANLHGIEEFELFDQP
jgi:restriction endonuclease Mrr